MSFYLKSEKIIKEWTDYNGHMNVAYYILIFDTAVEIMLNQFNMGGDSAKSDKRSTFTVESHITYNQEVKLDEEVDVHLTFLDHDKKRILYKLSMTHKEKKYLAATIEVLSLYIDLSQRKVIEIEDDKIQIIKKFISKNKENFKKEDLRLLNKLKK